MKLRMRNNNCYFMKKGFYLSLLLVASLITITITPLSAFNTSDLRNQVVNSGELDTKYYDSSGNIATKTNYEISVNKVVSQLLDITGEPLENQFDVKLIVESIKDYSGDTSTDVVTDVLPTSFQVNDGSFTGNGHPSNHNGIVSWPLAGVNPNAGTKIINGKTVYTYTMNYHVTFDNLGFNFSGSNRNQDLNDTAPLLSFSTSTTNSEVAFNIPRIKTWAFFKLYQKAAKIKPIGYEQLTGAVFDLYVDIEAENITEDTVPYRTNISDDLFGGGLFTVILPSGHTYLLKETRAPKGYKLAETPWKSSIAFGSEKITTISTRDGGSPVTSELLYNEKLPEKRNIKVTKKWLDLTDSAATHPSVEFTLYYESDKVVKTAFGSLSLPANSSDGEYVTFIDVPTMDAELNSYTYTLEETIASADDTYRLLSINPTADGFEVTNQYVAKPSYGLRINRTYEYYVDDILQTSQTIVGNQEEHTNFIEKTAFSKDINTDDFVTYDGKTYSFLNGEINVNAIAPRTTSIVSGNNTIQVNQENTEYIVTLHYQLFDVTNNEGSVVPPGDMIGPEDANHSGTGDQTSTTLYISLTMLSGIGLIYMMLPGVRKQHLKNR